MAAHSRQKKDMSDISVAMEHEFAEAEDNLRQEFEAQVWPIPWIL